MPIAKVQLPDGRIGRFEVPDGTTPEQVIAFASQQKIAEQPATPERQGFLQRAGGVVSKRVKDIGGILERRGPESIDPMGERRGVLGTIRDLPGTATLAAGQAALGVGEVAGEALISGIGKLTPEPVKEFAKETLQDFAQTKIGEVAITAFQAGGDLYEKFKANNPDAAQSLEGILGISGLAVGRKGAKAIAQEAADVASDAGILTAKAIPKSIDRKLSGAIKNQISKSIRPSVVKQRSAAQAKKYFAKAEDAIKTIVENKNNLNITDEFGDIVQGLPTNLRQFSEAIDTTKKKLFTEFDNLATQAGKKKVKVGFKNINKELDGIIKNRGNTTDIRKYAQSIKDEFAELGSFTPSEAQTRIQALNRKLNSIADFNSANIGYVDAVVANNLRENLDNAVVKATGKEFQILKNKYGALKTIEKDVARRAAVDARGNVKGLVDYTDIFTAAQVAQGAARLSTTGAADITGGIVARMFKEKIKRLNDPNRIVQDMFSNADKLMSKSKALKKPFVPKSATLRTAERAAEGATKKITRNAKLVKPKTISK
jgi:hypothetical protein